MIVVSNSSPLIALSAIGLFDLLATLYGAINIPQAVYEEVAVSGSGRAGSQEVAGSQWIISHTVTDQQSVARLMTESGLDRGESETILLAIQLDASLIILDDRDARRYAHKQKLSVIGTVGVLVLAKDSGIIPSVKQAMDALKGAGSYIHPALYEEAMKRASE